MKNPIVLTAAFAVACGSAPQPAAAPTAATASSAPIAAAPASTPPRAITLDAAWGPFRDLIGSWDGGASDGQSTGGLTVTADLEGKVLVRRGFNDSPRGHHEDLMIISRNETGALHADYFDNEGHVIRYAITTSADGRKIIFLSDDVPGAPRFRLTYDHSSANDLGILFEIAPPGATEFKRFTGGVVHRR